MKRIFLDTNFLMDNFIREEYFPISSKVLIKGMKEGCIFCISYLSLANFAYILRKQPKEILYSLLRDCLELFEIIEGRHTQINQAINLHASDFEDALQYSSAIESNCDCIITRNKKDFYFSAIPILTPSEYMEME